MSQSQSLPANKSEVKNNAKNGISNPTSRSPVNKSNSPVQKNNNNNTFTPLIVASVAPHLFSNFSISTINASITQNDEQQVSTERNVMRSNTTNDENNSNDNNYYSTTIAPRSKVSTILNNTNSSKNNSVHHQSLSCDAPVYSFNSVNNNLNNSTNMITESNLLQLQQSYNTSVFNPSTTATAAPLAHQSLVHPCVKQHQQQSHNITSNNLQSVVSHPYSFMTNNATMPSVSSLCTNNNTSLTSNDTSESNDISLNRTFSLTDLAMIPTLQDASSSSSTDAFKDDDDDFPKCEPVTVNDIFKSIMGWHAMKEFVLKNKLDLSFTHINNFV